MAFDAAIQAAIDEAAEHTDMNEGAAFTGGDFPLPAAGLVRLRFVEYIELGVHMGEFAGVPKKQEKARLTFELSGPNHPPSDAGVPQTMSFEITLSLSEKAKFFKMFKRMNQLKQVKHIAQLLGEAFIGNITHNTPKAKEGEAKPRTYANLYDENGYTMRPPKVENVDPIAGTTTTIDVPVDPPKLPLKVFLWKYATKGQWDDIFIDGKWDDKKDEKTGAIIKEGASKNYLQNRIRAAVNFAGSPIEALLSSGGQALDIPEAEKPARTETSEVKAGAAADPLAGM